MMLMLIALLAIYSAAATAVGAWLAVERHRAALFPACRRCRTCWCRTTPGVPR